MFLFTNNCTTDISGGTVLIKLMKQIQISNLSKVAAKFLIRAGDQLNMMNLQGKLRLDPIYMECMMEKEPMYFVHINIKRTM